MKPDFSLPQNTSVPHCEECICVTPSTQVLINCRAVGEEGRKARAFDKELTDVISVAVGPLLMGHLLDGN